MVKIGSTQGVPIVAIVDDDDSLRAGIGSLLRSLGFRVAAFASAEEFLGSGRVADMACLIVDLRLPGMSGIELQRDLSGSGRAVPTILISAHEAPAPWSAAEDGACIAFLRKPFTGEALVDVVRDAFAGEAGGRAN